MQLNRIKLNDIKPYENNPRINQLAIGKVAESIKQCGYISPIVVDEDMIILAGHTRFAALQLLGKEEADVLIVPGLSEEQKIKYRLLDNKAGELAEWDYNKLAAEIDGLDFEGVDFELEETITSDTFDDFFTLPDGDKSDIVTMSFNLKDKQWWVIESALNLIGDNVGETFGNTNKQGNALYTIVAEWAEARGLEV